MSNNQRGDRIWTPMFILILALTFCCFIMGQGNNSGTSVFLAKTGYGTSLAGALALVFSISAAVVRLLLGPIIDRGKASLVTIIGIVVVVLGTFMMGVVQGVPLYVVARFLQGAGFAAATTASAVAAADVLPMERLGEGIGYYGLGQALSMSVGPAFAIFLVGTDPATNVFLGIGLVGCVGFFIALNARYERHAEQLPESCAFLQRQRKREAEAAEQPDAAPKSLRESFDVFEPRALPGAIPQTILCATFGFGIFYAGLYGTSLGYASAGLFYTANAISMLAVRLSSKSYMDTVPAIKTYTVACACAFVAFIMLFFANASEMLFLAAGIPYGVALGLSLPLNQAVAVKNTPSERWGATNALFLLTSDLGMGVCGCIWGAVNDSWGFQASILIVMVLQVISYISAWVVYPAHDKKWKKE